MSPNSEARPAYTAAVITLGCRVNQYESRALEEELARRGVLILTPDDRCDLYIVNTCTVTSESDRKAGQAIRRARSLNPDAVIVVTGCLSQRSPSRVLESGGADAVCGNKSKLAAVDAAMRLLRTGRTGVPELESATFLDGSEQFERMSLSGFGRNRAYIKIEDGCDGRCAYCDIPAARGRVRSRPPQDIVDEVRAIASTGCREVVLTGIETSAYEYGLSSVARAVSEIDGVSRIRFGSLNPAQLRPDFFDELAAVPKVMPHFHLSMQSGCSRTLAAMRRRYTAQTAQSYIEHMYERVPGLCLTADFICGFPGETPQDFTETMAFLSRARFLRSHIFTYSVRPNTAAAAMPDQIPEEEKITRAALLAQVQRETTAAVMDSLRGQTRPVLVETVKTGEFYGHTDNFAEAQVRISAGHTPPHRSEIVGVRLGDACGDVVCGETA